MMLKIGIFYWHRVTGNEDMAGSTAAGVFQDSMDLEGKLEV
jgi:hypothetical protein